MVIPHQSIILVLVHMLELSFSLLILLLLENLYIYVVSLLYILKNPDLIKKQLSDKPGLARSYGSLSRLLFTENPISNETLEATKKWFIINEENRDIFGIIFSRNFLGKIYFNIHKTNQSKDDNLKNSKQQYNENIRLLNNKIDLGSKKQIFTSFADLMEIAKFEKDENTFLDLSSKLYNLLNDFEKIEDKFFIDIFKNAFSSKFKNMAYSKQNIKEIFN